MNWWRSAGVAVLVVPALALLAFGLTRDPRRIPSPLPGRAAPEFALEVMRGPESLRPEFPQPGDTVRLSDHRGEIVVLNYWASWCLACRDEHPLLMAAAQRYAPRGVRFYGILYNDTEENARSFIREMGGQGYPTLLDPGTRTAIDYGVYGVPETYFVGRDGWVAHKQIGPVTWPLLVEQIDSLLGARAPKAGGHPLDRRERMEL